MGNSNSNEGPNPLGGIKIQTEKPIYLPGETINGHIHIHLKQSVEGNKLFLRVKGKENTYWVTHHHVSCRARRDDIAIPHFGSKHFLNYQIPVHTWPQASVPAGQYSLPFSLVLPQNIPGTIEEASDDGHARIIYKLKAEIHSAESLEDKTPLISGKETLVIKEHISAHAYPGYADSNLDVKSWCFFPLGHVNVKFSIEKNQFSPGEIANVNCEIDNRSGRGDFDQICCRLSYTMYLANIVSHKEYSNYIAEVTSPALLARQTATGNERRTFALQINPKHAASAHGSIVKCDYKIQIYFKLNTNSPLGCNTEPLLEIPITILPPVPKVEAIEVPPDWKPQQIQQVTVALKDEFQYKKEVEAPGADGNPGLQKKKTVMPGGGAGGPGLQKKKTVFASVDEVKTPTTAGIGKVPSKQMAAPLMSQNQV